MSKSYIQDYSYATPRHIFRIHYKITFDSVALLDSYILPS